MAHCGYCQAEKQREGKTCTACGKPVWNFAAAGARLRNAAKREVARSGGTEENRVAYLLRQIAADLSVDPKAD